MGANALISAELVAELARTARQRPLMDFTTSGAEAGYRPSRGLAEFVRARDLTCRAPGCDRPATVCEIDHTIPWPAGPTHAGNLKCLCAEHHLLKTFWGWRDEQLPDGTVIWRLPGAQTRITTPGSALLFPSLLAPTPPRHRYGHPRTTGPGRGSHRDDAQTHTDPCSRTAPHASPLNAPTTARNVGLGMPRYSDHHAPKTTPTHHRFEPGPCAPDSWDR